MMAPRLVLASASPRRQKLLREAGFKFTTVAPRVRERHDLHLTARELTTWNALRKGAWAAQRHPGAVVLASDTLVSLNGHILGKPRDLAEAKRFLRRLRGQTHQVCTGVFICHSRRGRMKLFVELSHVRFRSLSEADITRYFSRVNPLDKAGAYAAQGYGRTIIAAVTGSFTNVIGLPMERTATALKTFGVRPRPNESRPARARAALSVRAGRVSKSGTKTKR
jgi:septum formation protein